MRRNPPWQEANHSPGVALVVTLMMMSVMVMMVVGLAGVMRNEQAAARNITYKVLAEQVAEVGARQGMTAVLTSTPAGGQITATGPGWILAGNTTRYLFSPAASAQEIKNIERIGTNSLILGLPTGTRGGIYAGWSNLVLPGQPADRPIARYAWWVDDEGTKLNLNAVGTNNTEGFLPLLTNFPFSADWVFVDPATGATNATNFAQAQALRSRVQWLPTPESLKGSNFLNFTNPQVSGGTNNLLREDEYHRIKGHVTTWSSNVDLTPWGTAKLNLADLANTTLYPNPKAGMLAVKSALATNAFTNFFSVGQNLARKYGGGTTTSTNLDNHGDLILQQIAANIMAAAGRPVTLTDGEDYFTPVENNDARRHRNNLPLQVASHYIGPYLDQVRVRVDYRIQAQTNVEARLGIWVRVVNPYNIRFDDWSLVVQPRKFIYGTVANGIITNETSTAPLSGYVGHKTENQNPLWIGPQWNSPILEINKWKSDPTWPTSKKFSKTISVESNSYSDTFFDSIISYTVNAASPPATDPIVRYAYVMLDQVCLYNKNDSDSFSLRDWLTHDDLAMEGLFRTQNDYGQFDFSDAPGTGNGPLPINVTSFAPLSTNDFAPATSLGVRRIDPQVRFPLSFWKTSDLPEDMGLMKTGGWTLRRGVGGIPKAWSRNDSFDCVSTNGSVTGLAYLWPDPAPGVNDVRNHPHFVPGYRPANGFRSVAQLGAIHTGIPWRTLRLQPQPSVEMAAANGATNSPPDWVLLDLFTATNPTVALPRVNLNGLITSLQASNNTNPGVPILGNQIQTRPWPLLGAMGTLRTNLFTTNTNAFISNGVPISLTNPATAIPTNTLMAFATNNVPRILSNPIAGGTNWAVNSGWGNQRVSLANRFPSNGLALTGELLEIRGVADDPTAGEDVIEGRLRGFLDMVTTRSDTFSVWSIGQGLVVVTNAAGTPIRTNAMAEVRKQTVFQRIPMMNASGVTTNYNLEVLYTRNHVVE